MKSSFELFSRVRASAFSHRRFPAACALALGLTLTQSALAQAPAAAVAAQPGAAAQPAAADAGSALCGCNDALWTIRAGALLLHRSTLPDRNLMVNNATTPIYNADQFDFPVQPGWEIDVLRRLATNSDWTVEAGYFNIRGVSADSTTIASSGAGVLGAPGTPGTALGIFGPSVDTTLRYKSELQNAELNLQRDVCDNLKVLAGVRFINLDERLAVSERTVSGNQSASQEMDAFNEMPGLQVGADAILWRCGNFSVESLVKAGILDDFAQNRTTYNSDSFDEHVRTGTSAERVAFCGDFSIILAYRLTENWSIRGGYRMLAIDGVALASEQAAANPIPTFKRATTVKTNGNLLYLGGMACLEYSL